MDIANFSSIADTVNIASQDNTSSAAVSLGIPANWIGGTDILTTNDTDKTIFVKFGASDVAAADATKDIPVKSGAIMIFGVGPKVTSVRAVTGSGSATGSIYFTPGKGS